MTTIQITVDGVAMVHLLGPQDKLLRMVEKEHPEVDVHVRGNEITLTGDAEQVAAAKTLVDELVTMTREGIAAAPEDVEVSSRALRNGSAPAEAILTTRGKVIRPKTDGQRDYVDAIDENTIVFGIGPAGTGKTYLAMAKAVQALQRREVSRIILTRPAVEAGERLGFLPGSLTDKIDPYLRPLYDALHDMLEPDSMPGLMAAGTIEVAPLAYMRGRTLNDAFIVLDEAQNTTPEQIKMFLTRLGFGSKIVVTGDVSQIDLPTGQRSGLKVVQEILTGVDDIAMCHLTSRDVVRHRLVSDIIDAYERWDATTAERPAGRRGQGGNRMSDRPHHRPGGAR
jgi:phosphate starvation-inducible PhoH-like protein